MSPTTAQSKKVGDYIARRGFQDHIGYTHVGVVIRKTRHALFIRFHDSKHLGTRHAYDSPRDMAKIRSADHQEVAGFERFGK